MTKCCFIFYCKLSRTGTKMLETKNMTMDLPLTTGTTQWKNTLTTPTLSDLASIQSDIRKLMILGLEEKGGLFFMFLVKI